MGLFSKKKEPVKTNHSFSSLASMNSPNLSNNIIPPPQPGLQNEMERARQLFAAHTPQNEPSQNNQAKSSFSITNAFVPPPPTHEENNESPFLQGVQITKQANLSGMQEGDDFHLPDFEDEDLKELSQVSSKEESEVKQVSPMTIFPPERANSQFFVKNEDLKLLPPTRQIQVRQSSSMTTSPSFIVGEFQHTNADKYLEMRTFFKIKENIAESKVIARSNEESMAGQHYRMRAEDYETLAKTLDEVQQKLMMIENKIFNANNPEVN